MTFPPLLYFTAGEFDAPDHIDPVTLNLLDRMRQHFGEPFTVTSDGRSPTHNAAVGGAETSLHLFDPAKNRLCLAVDFTVKYGEKPECWEKVDRLVSAWYANREKCDGRGTELEIVFSEKDRHMHIGVFPDKRPHRLVVKAD